MSNFFPAACKLAGGAKKEGEQQFSLFRFSLWRALQIDAAGSLFVDDVVGLLFLRLHIQVNRLD